MPRPAPAFRYRRHPDQDGREAHHPVVIIGGGMVGLTLALDLARQGHRPVVLERGETVSVGSRSICQAKRTLEIWDRLGVGEAMRDQGVTWQTGVVHHGARELYRFDLAPEASCKMPAFVNLQQYHVEERLVTALAAEGVEVRWGHAMGAIESRPDGVRLEVATPDGHYRLSADWVVACDGAKSPTRRALGLAFEGQVFEDKFLIADIRAPDADLPPERRFWFDPPFHDGQTALLHKQPDGLWRLDFQLGWDADAEREREPARVGARVQRMLPGVAFEMEWVSVYVFQCRTLGRYVHGRVVFAGDAAHQVSPFGARGGNGGVQDADNLGWKVGAVLRGEAGPGLIESYDIERLQAARENIAHSTRATDFMSPRPGGPRIMRDAVLAMAAEHPFARALVNPGRLSTPARYATPLSTPDAEAWDGGVPPGAPTVDAPLPDGGWLLERVGGRFVLMTCGAAPAGTGVETLAVEPDGLLARRYGLAPGAAYLFRPDQHVAGRWRRAELGSAVAARARAMGGETLRAA